LAGALATGLASVALGDARGEADDAVAIRATMSRYEEALNAADTSKVLPLYTDDGIFMQPYGMPVIGKAAIKKAYDTDFATFRLAVKFDVKEVVQMSPIYAYVRTQSAGTNTINATHAQSHEGNQELFILRKDGGSWLIARYSFSTTNPPHS
jgi:uncharacterized protein (TIGR02246 family)